MSPPVEKLMPVCDPVKVKKPWAAIIQLALRVNVFTSPAVFWSRHRSSDTCSDPLL